MTSGPRNTILSEDGRQVLCGNRACSLTVGYPPRREGDAPVLVAGYRQIAPGVWERRPVERGAPLAKPRKGDRIRCWACKQTLIWEPSVGP